MIHDSPDSAQGDAEEPIEELKKDESKIKGN
jgi:hypothetical protein